MAEAQTPDTDSGRSAGRGGGGGSPGAPGWAGDDSDECLSVSGQNAARRTRGGRLPSLSMVLARSRSPGKGGRKEAALHPNPRPALPPREESGGDMTDQERWADKQGLLERWPGRGEAGTPLTNHGFMKKDPHLSGSCRGEEHACAPDFHK